MPSLTFVASAHALAWQGITPVFCDVDPLTWTLDPGEVQDLITPATTGILGVHLWGNPCDTATLHEVALRHRLRLFFDAAHALGTTVDGRALGGLGDAAVFSFHATKLCNSFEGGVIATDDDELAARLAILRNFGFVDVDRVDALGINAKLSEVHAAMGLVSLDSMDAFVATNPRNMQHYRAGMQSVAGVTLFEPPLS